MRPSVLLAVAVACVASSAGAAPLWTVEKSEIAYLFYGEPDRPVLSISCGQQEGETGKDETRIEVEVETGTKPGKDKVVLRIEQDKGHKDVPLKPLHLRGVERMPEPARRRGLSLRSERPGQEPCARHRRQGPQACHRRAGRQDRRAGRSGGLQEILRQLPELVSRSVEDRHEPSSLKRTKRVHCSRVQREVPMRAFIATAFVTDFVRIFRVARAVDGFRRRCLPLQRLRLQRRLRLARPRRVLRRARETRGRLRHAGRRALQAGKRASHLLRQAGGIDPRSGPDAAGTADRLGHGICL